jgi:uncharacterized membrane protein YgdD (TMEM256/DUF423 family)
MQIQTSALWLIAKLRMLQVVPVIISSGQNSSINTDDELAYGMKYPYLFFAAANGFLVVALGAFGAHALDGRINVVMLDVYDTAVQYQMFHTVAFIATHLLARDLPDTACRNIARLFIAGIVLFSGSLYLLAITSMTWLGMITPIGGILLLAGWFQLARVCYKNKHA